MIAKFLLTAEEGAFLGCNGWDDRFSKPLGQPTGAMKQQKDGTLARSFASGTTVSWNPAAEEGARGSIDWASDALVLV